MNSDVAQDMRAKRVALELIIERMPAGCYECGGMLRSDGKPQYLVVHESENIMLLARLCAVCERDRWGTVLEEAGNDDDM